MKIEVRNESGVAIIKPDGRMDFNALSEFTGALNRSIQEGANKILIDFSSLEYMSSAGIRALMEGMKRLEPRHGVMAFCDLHPQIKELFEVVQLNKIFPIYSSEFEALDALMS
ncbi:MAG TPA: STAS domain-containing protein [bacterium]|nr:MAG: putative anti-sigma factor antagonist BtrV [Verrucomicrobia bacterium ADurb.Bin474]HQH74614.1 STAS domain-containing protein [bacterium]